MNRKRALTYLFIFAVLAMIGCKDDRPAEPEGIWIKNSTQAEGQVLGTLELKESSLFIFIAEEEGHTNTNGRYSLSGDHITFEDDSCFSAGTYSISLSQTKLTFTIISDHCTERAKVLEGTWTRSNQ